MTLELQLPNPQGGPRNVPVRRLSAAGGMNAKAESPLGVAVIGAGMASGPHLRALSEIDDASVRWVDVRSETIPKGGKRWMLSS